MPIITRSLITKNSFFCRYPIPPNTPKFVFACVRFKHGSYIYSKNLSDYDCSKINLKKLHNYMLRDSNNHPNLMSQNLDGSCTFHGRVTHDEKHAILNLPNTPLGPQANDKRPSYFSHHVEYKVDAEVAKLTTINEIKDKQKTFSESQLKTIEDTVENNSRKMIFNLKSQPKYKNISNISEKKSPVVNNNTETRVNDNLTKGVVNEKRTVIRDINNSKSDASVKNNKLNKLPKPINESISNNNDFDTVD